MVNPPYRVERGCKDTTTIERDAPRHEVIRGDKERDSNNQCCYYYDDAPRGLLCCSIDAIHPSVQPSTDKCLQVVAMQCG